MNVPYFWTSGRLCDFDGCDRPDFFPKNINGWFWSANQARLAPTDSRTAFHDWSATGGWENIERKKYVRKYLSLCANITDSVPAPSPSPTIGSRPSWAESPSRVWRCSTTFTATVRLWWSGDIFWWIVFQESSGTMWPVTTRSPSSARMSRVILPSPGRPSPTSGSLEWREHQAILIYLFLYLFTLCHRKVTRKKTGVLPENDHSDASLTFMCIL